MQNKISFTCLICETVFLRWPSAVKHAELRGSPIQFCSSLCVGAARSKGIIESRKKTGKTISCEVCEKQFHRKLSAIKNGRSRFCSEPCRQKAFDLKLIDRSQPRPANLKGETISCLICGESKYRKKSMIERNINKTCGKTSCISAYSRSLWSLPPRTPEEMLLPKPKRKVRVTNFTSKQRLELIGTHCLWCGTTKNLTLDHIIPVCAGGLSTKYNAQTLCGRCNNIKAKTTDKIYANRNKS
jgi:hypothetical protein